MQFNCNTGVIQSQCVFIINRLSSNCQDGGGKPVQEGPGQKSMFPRYSPQKETGRGPGATAAGQGHGSSVANRIWEVPVIYFVWATNRGGMYVYNDLAHGF